MSATADRASLKRIVGTWVGSPMAKLWIYGQGTLDAATNTLTLECDGPAFSGEGTARYQDTIQFLSDDVRTLNARVKNPDDSWHHFMSATFKRVK